MIAPPSKILDSFKRHLAEGEAVARPVRANAALNEKFVAGKQYGVLTPHGVVDDLWFDDEKVPRTYVNLCQGLMTTFSALLNKDRKSAIATPLTPDEPEDVYVAEICNRFIDFFSTEQKTADKIHQSVQYAFQGGSAGLKVWYDAAKDEIRWSRLTVHDFVFEPVEDWREAQWAIFDSKYSEDAVADLWKKCGLQSAPPKAEEYTNAAGQRVRGIKGHEYWHRPCEAYPDGVYACIIAGEVVECRPYPLAVPTDGDRVEFLLPFVMMKIRHDRESPYGITPLSDIINLQRQVNETEARITKLMRIVTHPQLKVTKSLANLDITTVNLIVVDDKDDGKATVEWTRPGTIDQNLFRTRDDKIAQMTDVIGLNAITTGANTTTQSGRAIEARYEIDAQKNSDALKSLDDMVLDAWRLTLALVQLHYSVKRQAKIVRQDAVDLISFSAADIMGSNIRLESASEIARRTDVRTADAVEKAQAGAGTSADVAVAQKTAPNAVAHKQAKRAVQLYLDGEDIDTTTLSMPALLGAIDRAKSRALSTSSRSDFSALMLLERLLREQDDNEPGADGLPPSSGTSGTQAAPKDTITSPEIQG